MKASKLKIGNVVIISIIILTIAVSYIRYMNLDIYTVEQNGDIVTKNGVVYKYDGRLSADYMDNLKSEKMIGRVKGDSFFGRRIYKLKGLDEKDSIALNGLMLQEVHTNENKQ